MTRPRRPFPSTVPSRANPGLSRRSGAALNRKETGYRPREGSSTNGIVREIRLAAKERGGTFARITLVTACVDHDDGEDGHQVEEHAQEEPDCDVTPGIP